MNRRELIRKGLITVGSVAVSGADVLRSSRVFGQDQPTKPMPLPRPPVKPAPRIEPVPAPRPTPAPRIEPAPTRVEPHPTAVRVEDSMVGFGLSPKGSVTVATVKTTSAVKKLPNAVPISPSRKIFMSTKHNVTPVAKEEISNHFFAFQTALVDGLPTVLLPNDVDPKIKTDEAAPDVLLDVSLDAFHLSESEAVNKDTRATLRLTINNEDDTERARKFDIVYWALTTGLNLFDDQLKTRIPKLNSSDLKADFKKALANRSIELPGGIGSIRFEVIRHKEPPWWRKLFKFGSEGGKALTAVLGFPALTAEVLDIIDGIPQFQEADAPQILFKSRSLKFAFSKQARDALTEDGLVKVGVLNPGIWLLARGRDFDTLRNAKAYYFQTYGLLVPAAVTEKEVVNGEYEDLFKDVTYAVLKAKIRPYKICT